MQIKTWYVPFFFPPGVVQDNLKTPLVTYISFKFPRFLSIPRNPSYSAIVKEYVCMYVCICMCNTSIITYHYYISNCNNVVGIYQTCLIKFVHVSLGFKLGQAKMISLSLSFYLEKSSLVDFAVLPYLPLPRAEAEGDEGLLTEPLRSGTQAPICSRLLLRNVCCK